MSALERAFEGWTWKGYALWLLAAGPIFSKITAASLLMIIGVVGEGLMDAGVTDEEALTAFAENDLTFYALWLACAGLGHWAGQNAVSMLGRKS